MDKEQNYYYQYGKDMRETQNYYYHYGKELRDCYNPRPRPYYRKYKKWGFRVRLNYNFLNIFKNKNVLIRR